jgi:hypothetical protein
MNNADRHCEQLCGQGVQENCQANCPRVDYKSAFIYIQYIFTIIQNNEESLIILDCDKHVNS